MTKEWGASTCAAIDPRFHTCLIQVRTAAVSIDDDRWLETPLSYDICNPNTWASMWWDPPQTAPQPLMWAIPHLWVGPSHVGIEIEMMRDPHKKQKRKKEFLFFLINLIRLLKPTWATVPFEYLIRTGSSIWSYHKSLNWSIKILWLKLRAHSIRSDWYRSCIPIQINLSLHYPLS